MKKTPIVFPPNWKNVTDQYIGKTIAIIGAAAPPPAVRATLHVWYADEVDTPEQTGWYYQYVIDSVDGVNADPLDVGPNNEHGPFVTEADARCDARLGQPANWIVRSI